MMNVSTEDLLERTKAMIERLDPDGALAAAARLMRTAPASDAAHFALGLAAAKKGRDRTSLGALRNAARINRTSPLLARTLGEALLRTNDPEAAVVAFRASLDRGETVDARVGLGASYAALGHLDAAERALSDVLDACPEHPIATLYMGLIAESARDLVRAIRWYRVATTAAPDAVVAWVNLGRVLARHGATEEARDALNRALILSPGHFEARAELQALSDAC